jgi:hypothetical protein
MLEAYPIGQAGRAAGCDPAAGCKAAVDWLDRMAGVQELRDAGGLDQDVLTYAANTWGEEAV